MKLPNIALFATLLAACQPLKSKESQTEQARVASLPQGVGANAENKTPAPTPTPTPNPEATETTDKTPTTENTVIDKIEYESSGGFCGPVCYYKTTFDKDNITESHGGPNATPTAPKSAALSADDWTALQGTAKFSEIVEGTFSNPACVDANDIELIIKSGSQSKTVNIYCTNHPSTQALREKIIELRQKYFP